MKLNKVINDIADRFAAADLHYGHGTDNPYDESVYLTFSLLGIDFEQDPRSLKRTLSNEELQLLDSKVRQRIEERTPVAFLVGEAWFAGHKFNCDARALIPRSPIAELIRQKFQPLIESPPRRILDLCCGGGCIGIACAHEFPDSQVDLVDLPEDCLALAADNVALHKLAERVSCVRSDLFSGLEGAYDLIVSNPPYVSRQELEALPAEYGHEPQLGLLSRDDGLQIPLTVLQRAGNFLTSDGLLIMEVGYSAELLVHRLPDVPFRWLEFEHGGEGVFALQAAQLRQYSDSLN